MAGKYYCTPVGTNTPTTRKHLNADALFALLRDDFRKVRDYRAPNTTISICDALMSGFAVFSLKEPSLLAFEERRQSEDPNLHRVFGIEKVPSDTQMREILEALFPIIFAYPPLLSYWTSVELAALPGRTSTSLRRVMSPRDSS